MVKKIPYQAHDMNAEEKEGRLAQADLIIRKYSRP